MVPKEGVPMEPPFIEEIRIRHLFGRYDYTLTRPDPAEAPRNLLLLYGDNGTGKTTILKTVFHLLSSGPKRGHRTALARTPFEEFSVRLSTDIEVSATRHTGDVLGSYRLQVTGASMRTVSTDLDPDADLRILRDVPHLDKIESALRAINIDLFFISDDRRVYSDQFDTEESPRRLLLEQVRQIGVRAQDFEIDSQAAELGRAMQRASEWISAQMLRSTDSAEKSSHAIYADVVTRLTELTASPEDRLGVSSAPSLGDLSDMLIELERRSADFSRYGLTRRIEVAPILAALRNTREDTHPVVASVLMPYLDGLKARLQALEDTYELVSPFIDTVNDFFWDKHIEYDSSRGLRVLSDGGGNPIDPSNLSSGERQLLMLLCNTLYMRDQTTLFLVDEPELSLNVKWQRKLVDALLTLTATSPSQFLLATHSLELLTSHSESVVQLVPGSSPPA